jgi:geranylgeranyl pyrophosphate synthase
LHILERIALYWGLSYQIVDDLKDLQSSAEAGKTACRDLSLDRPNIALAIGIGGSVERLARLLHLGDRMLRRLSAIRPAFGFLETLRVELGEETLQLTQGLASEATSWSRQRLGRRLRCTSFDLQIEASAIRCCWISTIAGTHHPKSMRYRSNN